MILAQYFVSQKTMTLKMIKIFGSLAIFVKVVEKIENYLKNQMNKNEWGKYNYN